MPHTSPIIVWFRRDLRLGDNPALAAAAQGGRPILPLFILDPDGKDRDPYPPGTAGRWWLRHSLKALDRDLASLGLPLGLRRGDEIATLTSVAAAVGARAVFCNQVLEPWRQARDRAVAEALAAAGIGVAFFSGSVLFDPGLAMTGRTTPWTRFGPFWRRCLSLPVPGRPLPAPKALPRFAGAPPTGDALDDWALEPVRPQGWDGVARAWTPGESGARARLEEFLDAAADCYANDRDMVDRAGTSRLSPHLHWGEISVRQVWHGVSSGLDGTPADVSRHAFLRQLGWREFSTHLLHHYPDLPEKPLNSGFQTFPTRTDPDALSAWQQGRTGYPLVDAAMRQLWHTGWMHNRLRMVAASFLVKHLLLPWQSGAAWFWDQLVDADLANNAASWQWVAGCGTDSVPFFRIFNPTLQGRRFDPDGVLIRQYLPELGHLPLADLHDPWRHPERLTGTGYPPPLIEHAGARARALAAFHGRGH